MLGELRKRFHDDIRNKQIEGAKTPIRQSMLKQFNDLSMQLNEDKIIDNMKRHIFQHKNLDYGSIITLVESSFQFSNQFKNEFCYLVLQHLRNDWKCLKSLSIIIEKCGLMEPFEKINISELLKLLMDENSRRSAEEVEIVFDFIQILFKQVHNKECFRVLSMYEEEFFSYKYQPFAIRLLVQLALSGILLPSSQCIEQFLTWALEEQGLTTRYFQNVSKLVLIYVLTNSDLGGLARFKTLVEKNSIVKEFSLNICKMATQLLFEHNQDNHNHEFMRILQKVSILLGTWEFVHLEGLQIYSIILQNLQPEERIPIIEKQHLVEKIFYTFDNHLTQEDLFQLFSLMMYCFDASDKYVYQAASLGFGTILRNYEQQKTFKVGSVVDLILYLWTFDK